MEHGDAEKRWWWCLAIAGTLIMVCLGWKESGGEYHACFSMQMGRCENLINLEMMKQKWKTTSIQQVQMRDTRSRVTGHYFGGRK
jgi:hypothetical protein